MDEVDREWLSDMLEYSKAAVRILSSRNAAELDADETILLAVSQAIVTIGEAANHVSPGGQALLSEIPWLDIIGMRHRLVHGYRTRSAQVITDTVRDHLPQLISALEQELGSKDP